MKSKNCVGFFYNLLGARRSWVHAITHRLLSFFKESQIWANQRRVFFHDFSGGPQVDCTTLNLIIFNTFGRKKIFVKVAYLSIKNMKLLFFHFSAFQLHFTFQPLKIVPCPWKETTLTCDSTFMSRDQC